VAPPLVANLSGPHHKQLFGEAVPTFQTRSFSARLCHLFKRFLSGNIDHINPIEVSLQISSTAE